MDWLVEIDDISFDQGVQTTVLQKASGNPKLLFTQKFANPTGAAVEQTLKRVLTKAASFEFLMTQTLAATAAVKGTARVPGAGFVEASLSIALTLAFGEKWTDTTTETFEFSSTIKVPANTTVNALGSLIGSKTLLFRSSFIFGSLRRNAYPTPRFRSMKSSESSTILDLMARSSTTKIWKNFWLCSQVSSEVHGAWTPQSP